VQVSSVYPSSGPLAGGSWVTIQGKGLGNGTDIVTVSLAGVNTQQITQQSFDTVIVVSSASSSSVSGIVTVTSASYGDASGSTYTYNPGM